MKDSICFNLQEKEFVEQKIEKLKTLLHKSGIEVVYASNNLIFNFDTLEVEKKATRHAGRKRTEGNQNYITVGDVKAFSKTMTHKEIYNMLNVSKATYFRRKREAVSKQDSEMFLI